MKKLSLIIFLIIINNSFAQVKDSIKIIPDFRINRLQQTKICKNLRVGLGIQKSFVSEIGYSRMKHISSCTGFFSKTYYSSIEYVPKTSNYKDVFGLKIGLEYNLSIIAVGLETKYQTDFNNKDVVITPKIGLGFSCFNLFYGYNISTNKNPFPSVGNHQFSLVFNIPITSRDISK
jgi:hypothetical protein